MLNHWTPVDKILRRLRLHKVEKYIKEGNIICDLGCGQEAFLLCYFSHKIMRGFGFDMQIKDFEQGNLIVKRATLEHSVPLESEFVDVITLLAALEHFNDEVGILVECHRILKKGGVLLITVPTHYNRPLLETIASIGVIDKSEILDHKRYYYKSDLEKALLEAGFLVENIELGYWQFGLNLFAKAIKF